MATSRGEAATTLSASFDERHRTALLDWLACAHAGAHEPATIAARTAGNGVLEDVASLATTGHVLDFDDTYLPGIAHLSAPTAPAALVLGAALGATAGDVLGAYAAGFEQMAALARASHPVLYDRGWHPTAVCGTVGAASAAAALLGLRGEALESALALASLRASGSRAGFGSDGKALGVGLAAAAGVQAARLAAAGARMPVAAISGPAGFEAVTGGTWATPDPVGEPAVARNWIKPWPCCLMAHSAIEAALALRTESPAALGEAGLVVRVHPRARQAAAYDDVADGLQAKFSIPYLTAFAFLRGAPGVADLRSVDADVRAFASTRVRVVEDDRLAESEVRLEHAGSAVVLAAVVASIGSPERPMSAAQLTAKISTLAPGRLAGVLDDLAAPAATVLAAVLGD